MLGVVPELVGVEGAGSETETGSGMGTEIGTEVLRNLVLSEEDTMDGTGREVTEPWTDTSEGLGQYGPRKLHYVLPSQSTDYLGLISQVQVQQENHDPTWLIKTGSAEEFHKGT